MAWKPGKNRKSTNQNKLERAGKSTKRRARTSAAKKSGKSKTKRK